jgi:hypothetical protein
MAMSSDFLLNGHLYHLKNSCEFSLKLFNNCKPTSEPDSLLSVVRRVRHPRPAYLGVTFEEQTDKIIIL